MAFEPGGMSEKLGNRYESRWVAKQLLRLLNEEIRSVTVEPIGPDEQGVDLIVVDKTGIRLLQQCKARCDHNSWSVAALRNKGILGHLKAHLSKRLHDEFVLVSAIPPERTFADICESARNSNDNPKDFWRYQVEDIGEERRKTFSAFCEKLELDPQKDDDLATAFDYLKRTHIELFPDDHNTFSDLLTKAGFILTGEPKSAISILTTYANNNDMYRKSIRVDQLWRHLKEKHGIHPKRLEHDSRISPAIEDLQNQFFESINPGLINRKIISRGETTRIIDAIDNGQDVVVHGAAGNGKSGVLYELAEHLRQKNVPFLPIRLDTRVPGNTAKQFGQDLDLPESPAHCLAGLAEGRKSVLILDQLDAIRWTASHSSTAMCVCKELLRQTRSFRKDKKQIVIVFACRTFDLENDPDIKNLFAENSENVVVKVPVAAFSDEQLKDVIGPDAFVPLNGHQKRVLSCPHNLAIWLEIKKEEGAPSFRTATELMRQFWKNRRQHLNKAGISNPQSNAFLEPLINYMECQGKISAPATIVEKTPDVLDAFISFGILQRSAKHNINFCHQRYLDHLIAERLLRNIFQESDSVLSWLGKKGNQSLFRREQLRQALAMLSEESPTDFFNTTRKLLESKAVRFHLKHLVLELIGQFDVVADDIGEYFLELLNKPYWREHVQQTVFLRHHPWVSYLLNAGLISKWLESDGVREINSALWLLHSVAEDIPDPVTEILAPLVDRGSEWPNRILTAICRNEMDDSEKMFELRLQLARLGVVKDFVIWESLCAKYPLRAVQLIEAVLSARNINDRATSRSGKNPLECLYDDDLEALNDAVEKCPSQTWNLLMPHVERLTNIPVDDYDHDERLQNWREERTAKSGMDVARGTVELLKRALATEQPDELIARIAPLKKGISPIIQEIIIAAYTHLPARYADTGIAWLLDDLSRFRLGFGYREPEWMPAVRLVEALSPHCSEKLFRRLEEAIYHYHAPEEKREARYCVKLWRKNAFCHYWGKTQHFLLPALDATRVSPQTSELIRVLERKFANYAKDQFFKGGGGEGGWVDSTLSQNLEKISDQAWLKIVTSKKVTESDRGKFIQAGQDRVITTSIPQFALSLTQITNRYPERFGRLALKFPHDVDPRYVSAILEGLRKIEPDEKMPKSEKTTWQAGSIQIVEAVLEKYGADSEQDTALSFCQLVGERADESWSDKSISKLLHYARNHPDPEPGKLNIHSDSDENSDEVTVDVLFVNAAYCVRGAAAIAISRLLWKHNDRLEQVRSSIESLVSDPHPAVRMAAIEAIKVVFNIDKDLAVSWFCKACRDDLRVAASPRAFPLFNYIAPSHIDQVGPVIQHMAASSLDEVAFMGAQQVTARWLFDCFFENEFASCCQGTVPQRKGVANVAAALLHNKKYSPQCQQILCKFMNDPDKEVRDELRGMFRNQNLIIDTECTAFIKAYIESLAFADDPNHFVWSLRDLTGSLIPVAEAVFTVCERFSMALQEKNHLMTLEVSSILLRLYESAQGGQKIQITDRCLDTWDLLFENRVEMAMGLTRNIEQ